MTEVRYEKDVGSKSGPYLQHFDCPWLNTVRLTGCDLLGAGDNQRSSGTVVEHDPYRLSIILTSARAIASALAHITPAGPAPMIKTSTRLSRGGMVVMVLVIKWDESLARLYAAGDLLNFWRPGGSFPSAIPVTLSRQHSHSQPYDLIPKSHGDRAVRDHRSFLEGPNEFNGKTTLASLFHSAAGIRLAIAIRRRDSRASALPV